MSFTTLEELLENVLENAKGCAAAAGEIIYEAFMKPKGDDYVFKSERDLVTETDEKSERYIVNFLKSKFPSATFVAEEDVSSGKV